MKKIVYIVKTKLHFYPPCVSQIRILKDMGLDVEVLYGTSDESAIKLLSSEKIKCKKIENIKDENKNIVEKMISWYAFRKGLLKEIKKYDEEEVLFWFGTAESVIPLKGALKNKKYVVSLLELMDEEKLKRHLLKNIIRGAKAITVCEETRGYLQQSWWKLNVLPFVLPNKPYKHIREKCCSPTCAETKKVITDIGDEQFILYQGIIQNTEELIEFAKALNHTKKRYKFVLMGIDKYNSIDAIKKVYTNILYISYIPAPLHLEITSRARIGITFYRPDSLNKVFCAPNKIYEYSGFGIPIIGNNIPGLSKTVGHYNAAICTEFNTQKIVKAIDKIEESYEQYSENAMSFFDSTDNVKTTKALLKYIGW